MSTTFALIYFLSLNESICQTRKNVFFCTSKRSFISLFIYLPLIQKDSSTHIHGLAVYVKEGLPFAWDLFLKNSAGSYLCFQLALLHSVSYFFSSIDHLLQLSAWFLAQFHLT